MPEETGQAQEQPSDFEVAKGLAEKILKDEAPKDAPKTSEKAPKTDNAAVEGDDPQKESPKAETKPVEENAAENQSQPERYKLTVKSEDGSDAEVEVDIDGLKRGFMMEKDYRAKTAQLARAREEADAKIKSAIEPRLKEYDEKLQLAEQVIWHTLAPEIQKTDWNKLSVENPAEWAQKMQIANNVNAKLAALKSERIKVAEELQKSQLKDHQKSVQEAVETLKDPIKGIPGWNTELYTKILQYGQVEGFKQEEVNAITDPRMIKLLWKAEKYDSLQKAKPAVEKLVKTTPKVIKPGTAEKPDGNTDAYTKAMARLKKTGTTSDAVAVAKLILG